MMMQGLDIRDAFAPENLGGSMGGSSTAAVIECVHHPLYFEDVFSGQRFGLDYPKGRRVASLEWPGQAGFNTYCWDGRDSQGNVTANGLYFYRLTAVDATGHRASQDGRMIRAR